MARAATARYSPPPSCSRPRPTATATRGTATYRVTAPGGMFDAADNGTYVVRLESGAVALTSDSTGDAANALTLAPAAVAAARGQAIGRVEVRSPARRTPAVAPPLAARARQAAPPPAAEPRRAAEG